MHLISIVSLAAILIGFLFKIKLAVHLGAAAIIVTNLGILVVGAAYLISVPFTDGPVRGVACLLLPPYTIHYWVKHWPKMRRPVINTAAAFLPICVAGLAYYFYKDGPAIEATAERRLPGIEQKVERKLESVDPWKDDLPQESKPRSKTKSKPHR